MENQVRRYPDMRPAMRAKNPILDSNYVFAESGGKFYLRLLSFGITGGVLSRNTQGGSVLQ
jgi:hypothetical protein